MPFLEVNDLKYRYPHTKRNALCGITFSAEAGSFVGLLGACRSGRSTLCCALAGLAPQLFRGAYGGSVVIGGKKAASTPLSELCRDVGLVFQNPFNQLSGAAETVFEEVAFGLQNLGVPRDEIFARVEEALTLLDLKSVRDRNPFDLSGGQIQRTAIAAVLAMRPSLLILDEPTSQLDPQGSEEVFRVVERLRKTGITIVMAEQKPEKLAAYCDRILLLSDGSQIAYDTAERIFSRSDLADYGVEAPVCTRLCRALQLSVPQEANKPASASALTLASASALTSASASALTLTSASASALTSASASALTSASVPAATSASASASASAAAAAAISSALPGQTAPAVLYPVRMEDAALLLKKADETAVHAAAQALWQDMFRENRDERNHTAAANPLANTSQDIRTGTMTDAKSEIMPDVLSETKPGALSGTFSGTFSDAMPGRRSCTFSDAKSVAVSGVHTGHGKSTDQKDLLSLSGISFSYDGKTNVLSSLDFSLDERPTAIIGQNGAGKTTLLKLMKGLLKPTSGLIRFRGEDLSKKDIAALAGSIGYVFQNPDDQIFKNTVLAETAFGPLQLGRSAEEARKRSVEALETLGLASLQNENPYDLDLSDRKLVALASVLSMQPDVLLLDEPTIAQDLSGKKRIAAVIREFAASGRSVAAILHDMEFAAACFSRILVMAHGKILADGTPDAVFSQKDVLREAKLAPPQLMQLVSRT